MIKPSKLRKSRLLQRRRRHQRIRKKVRGTLERPRLVVFRSNRHIEGQVIDDDSHHTIVGLSTLDSRIRGIPGNKTEAARAAGRLLAEEALSRGVRKVVFDRGGFRYHGRVKAFADGAREKGLAF